LEGPFPAKAEMVVYCARILVADQALNFAAPDHMHIELNEVKPPPGAEWFFRRSRL